MLAVITLHIDHFYSLYTNYCVSPLEGSVVWWLLYSYVICQNFWVLALLPPLSLLFTNNFEFIFPRLQKRKNKIVSYCRRVILTIEMILVKYLTHSLIIVVITYSFLFCLMKQMK